MDTEHLIKRDGWYWVQITVPAKLSAHRRQAGATQVPEYEGHSNGCRRERFVVTKFKRTINAARAGRAAPSAPVNMDKIEARAIALRGWKHPDKELIVGDMAEDVAVRGPRRAIPPKSSGMVVGAESRRFLRHCHGQPDACNSLSERLHYQLQRTRPAHGRNPSQRRPEVLSGGCAK